MNDSSDNTVRPGMLRRPGISRKTSTATPRMASTRATLKRGYRRASRCKPYAVNAHPGRSGSRSADPNGVAKRASRITNAHPIVTIRNARMVFNLARPTLPAYPPSVPTRLH